jgi:hypothetical protein
MSDDAIRSFWAWWAANRGALATAIEARALRPWVEPISARARAIAADLEWELGKGRRAAHYLCLSAKGDPLLRATTGRWRALGPPDDAVFEYLPARPGGGYVPHHALRFGELPFPMGDFRVRLEIVGARRAVNVGLWHPAFARAPLDLRGTATFVALDAVLGEDDVESFLGTIDTLDGPPEGGVELGELVEIVERMREAENTFAVLKGRSKGGAPVFVTADLGVKRLEHLGLDAHAEVRLPLEAPTPDGLTTQAEADRLNVAEDALVTSLGKDGCFIARETGDGARTIHFHVNPAGAARLRAWAAGLAWRTTPRIEPDPAWEILRRW